MSVFKLTTYICFILVSFCMLACGSAQETTNAYTRARPLADAAATVMTLKQIATAEQNYFARTGNAYGTFDQLVESGALDERFRGAEPVVNGYLFRMKVTALAGKPAYSVNADPQFAAGSPATGARHYFMNSDGAIHYNESQAASGSDPVLQ